MKACFLALLGLSMALATTDAFSAKLACPVSGKAVNKSVSSEFDGGKVYFCCTHCKAKFDADSAKFATKADLQLAESGQAKQVACPFSGKALDASTTLNVSGVDVQFCCSHCKAKVAAAKPNEQIQMVFNSKSFKKAFKVSGSK